MANYISEDQIEKAIIEVFTHNLDYCHINCLESDTTGRQAETDVVIKPLLRTQLELINQTLAEMQANNNAINKPRRQIGFISHNEETTK